MMQRMDRSMVLMVAGSSEVKEYGKMTRDDATGWVSKTDDRRCSYLLGYFMFSNQLTDNI